jgi:hypothetical protein
MPLSSYHEFATKWTGLGENSETHAVEAAWKRYEFVTGPSYAAESDEEEPLASQLQSDFEVLIKDPAVECAIAEHKCISLLANRIPWTATGFCLNPGDTVSTLAFGRVWRSRLLDLWLRPQFALWFKIGINGVVFNSTWHSNTFTAAEQGELYVANQFPGQFGEPKGGRLVGPLNAHDRADGQFEIFLIAWKDGVNVSEVLEKAQLDASSEVLQLARQELERIKRDAHPSVPDDWKLLWFLGTSSIYSLREHESQPCMHCKPYHNVGILQKDLTPTIPFMEGTRVSWDWYISSLPSRLREDLTISHDYLSIAFEFENGRDLTYYWSWELPKEFGYWCPLPAWADREYHIVIRSGTDELGQWLHEERDLYADYVKHVEKGKLDSVQLPQQIVRVWFVAGNRWQRLDGEMNVKQIRTGNGNDRVQIL